uniref:DUF1725 domain-containing protein n=1 Tax=Sus scrofa TaxID=9823 RepID=A0A8D1A626_PIG
ASGYSSDWTPSLGTSICHGSGPRNGKKKKKSLQIINAGEGVEKREPSNTWERKLVHLLWRRLRRFLKKIKIELRNDPAIPLLGIYSEKTIIPKNTCTPMFIAALFTIAKKQKQPKYPLPKEWIKKMWYIYTMEYYSSIKKNEITPFAAKWTDPEIIISEVSQTEKDNLMRSFIRGI